MMTTRLIRGAIAALTLVAVPGAALAAGHTLLGHTGWRAVVDRSQPGGLRLVVTAKLTLPTPGYKASLRLAGFLKSNPPVPLFELVLTPPTKFVTQVVTTIDFKYAMPLARGGYRAIVITYRGKQLTRLAVEGAPARGKKT